MKHSRLILSLLCFVFNSYTTQAQKDSIPKYDTQWIINNSKYHVLYDFSSGSRNENLISNNAEESIGFIPEFHSFAFADKSGEPLLYFSGCQLFGTDGERIKNAPRFRVFFFDTDANCGDQNNTMFNYHNLFLIPISEKKFHAVHKKFRVKSGIIKACEYWLSKIEINEAGNPEVSSEGKHLYSIGSYTLFLHDIVRADNRNQWWIVGVPIDSTRGYILKYDLNEEEIVDTLSWSFPHENNNTNALYGKLKFSPDGNWLLYQSIYHGSYIYKFDRSTGNLELAHFIPRNETMSRIRSGSFWSTFGPRSRYLFWNENQRIFRYDLHSDHFIQDRELVVSELTFSYDTEWFQVLGRGMLAPDCQIYYNSWNGGGHRILERPWSDEIPTLSKLRRPEPYTSTGNFFQRLPNYRIDLPWNALCDTTTSSTEYGPEDETLQLKVYPNPGDDQIYLKGDNTCRNYSLHIYNQVGVRSIEIPEYHSGTAIDVSGLSSGMYFLQAENCDGKVMSAKWIKL